MVAEFKFRASDAFVYVDTYRREILHPVARIQSDLSRVRETSTTAQLSPTRYYAELRALEHALAFVLKREEPNVVALGEVEEDVAVTDPNAPGGKAIKGAKQLAVELSRCEEHSDMVEAALKHAKGREHELQAEIVARDQQIARLNHRYTNAQSTVTVLSVTLAVTAIALVASLFS